MDVFGNVHLGYAVIGSEKLSDWQRFGAEAIGMHVDQLDQGSLRFRLDENECRFLVERRQDEDVTAVGWKVDDHQTFDNILARVHDAGVPLIEGNADDCARRGVERLWRFPGPKGLDQEIFTTEKFADEELAMNSSGFVTGAGGMGHVALTSKHPAKIRGYYNNVFDARLSDYIDETFSGVKLKIRFLRVNERHHSIAVASTVGFRVDPVPTRVQHLNTQVVELDDMASSFVRAKELGFEIALDIGQHTNDKELSYYVQTPSGFEWEVGWNPIVVDESTWKPTTHKGISVWGHQQVGQTIIDRLEQLRVAIASLTRREETVPALSGEGIADD